jgi:hypothetical protein
MRLTAAAALVVSVSCGGDDAGQADSAKTRRDSNEQQVDASVQVALPEETAGKGCTADEDCGPGTCLVDFQASGGGMMAAPGGYCSLTCMTNDNCGVGGTCSGAFAGFGGIGAMPGRCLKSCAMDADCRDGYRCVTALGVSVNASSGAQDPTGGLLGAPGCEPTPETQQLEDGVVGKPCEKHSDCGTGRCQRAGAMLTYPGGYCSGACLQDSECGSEGVCTPPAAGGAGTCSLRCAADGDCREGYRCRSSSSGQLQCVPGAAPLPDGVVGNACRADKDCGGAAMSCAARLGNADTIGGYCSQTCVDASDCGTGGACVGGLTGALAGLLGSTSSCYRACSAAEDCREGYTCGRPTDVFGTASTESVCIVAPSEAAPDNTDADAGADAP